MFCRFAVKGSFLQEGPSEKSQALPCIMLFTSYIQERERENYLIIKMLLLMISIENELMSHDNDNCINILKNKQKYYLLLINLVNYHFNSLNLNFVTLIAFIKKKNTNISLSFDISVNLILGLSI